MTSTEIALLLNSNSEKITRIGEIIGKKIEEKDNFENLNEFEKTFILIDVLNTTSPMVDLFNCFSTHQDNFPMKYYKRMLLLKRRKQ